MSDYISVNMVSGRTNFFVLFRLRFPGATATTSSGRREEAAKATKAAQIRLKQKLQNSSQVVLWPSRHSATPRQREVDRGTPDN